jgi:hypothetical protein
LGNSTRGRRPRLLLAPTRHHIPLSVGRGARRVATEEERDIIKTRFSEKRNDGERASARAVMVSAVPALMIPYAATSPIIKGAVSQVGQHKTFFRFELVFTST